MHSSPLRVLVIVTTRFAKNGISAVVKNYAQHIDPKDVSFDYVLMNEPEKENRELLTVGGGRIFVIPRRNRLPLSYIRKLTAIMAGGSYDIVHAHGNSATLYAEVFAAKKAGIPVRIPHSHNTKTGFPLVHTLLKKPFSALVTDRLACGLDAGRWLYGNAPFTVLRNAIDTERFTFSPILRQEARKAWNLEGCRVYAHAGSFNKQKNHTYLIDSFMNITAKDPSARLLLAGTGKKQKDIKKKVKLYHLSDKVLFLPADTDVKKVYAAADAFLLPSLHEGLPLTLLEAQCMGLPCLASSAVTQEADITDSVTYAVLSEGMSRFAEKAAALPQRDAAARQSYAKKVRNAGWDIRESASSLSRFYRLALDRAKDKKA